MIPTEARAGEGRRGLGGRLGARAVRPRLRWGWAFLLLALTASPVLAQSLRYDYHQELTGSIRYRDFNDPYVEHRQPVRKMPPEYATLRIGPFYSTATFTQSAGYSYVRTEGSGANYLYGNRRGEYLQDGSDIPLISRLDTRNYLLITENMDLDLSLSAVYEYYPLDTREDTFYVDVADEGIYANISLGLDITPFLLATLYDRFAYRTDYVDTRGIEDRYGGSEYRYIQNTVGLALDWRLSKDRSLVGDVSREDYLPQDEEFEEQERITYRESLTYWQQIMPELRVGARATFSQTEYTKSPRNDWNQSDYELLFDFGKGVGDETGLGMGLTRYTTLRVGIGYSAGYSTSRGVEGADGETFDSESESTSGSFTGFGELTTQLREDLSHTFDYRRGLRTGWNTDYEWYTTYGYALNWKGEVSSAGIFTRVYEVEPSGDTVSDYRDWQSGVRGNYPLTAYAMLFASSIYTVRDNGTQVEGGDPEWTEDYETWSTRVGTSFAITANLSFITYYDHIERYGDDPNQDFVRDLFEALFSYRYQF